MIANRLIDRVLEAKQVGVLYHYTSCYGAVGILTKMKMVAHDLHHHLEGYSGVSFTNNARGLRSTINEWRLTFNGDRMSNTQRVEPYAARGFGSGTTYDEYETVMVVPEGVLSASIKPQWITELAISESELGACQRIPEVFTWIPLLDDIMKLTDRLGIPFRAYKSSGRSRNLTDQELKALVELPQRVKRHAQAYVAQLGASA